MTPPATPPAIQKLCPPARMKVGRGEYTVVYDAIASCRAGASDVGDDIKVVLDVAQKNMTWGAGGSYLVTVEWRPSNANPIFIADLYNDTGGTAIAATQVFRAGAWLLGAPYAKHDTPRHQQVLARDGLSDQALGLLPLHSVGALIRASELGYRVRSLEYVYSTGHPHGSGLVAHHGLLVTVLAPTQQDLLEIAGRLEPPLLQLGVPGFGLFAWTHG